MSSFLKNDPTLPVKMSLVVLRQLIIIILKSSLSFATVLSLCAIFMMGLMKQRVCRFPANSNQ